MKDIFNLNGSLQILKNFQYKKVVLQFPDEYLQHSVTIYDYMRQNLAEDVDIGITADSSWGSSIDDVSALHYDCEVLVYFGSDLSSSGSIPVILVPPIKAVDVKDCINCLNDLITEKYKILFYEAGCTKSVVDLKDEWGESAIISKLPPFADLGTWSPDNHRDITLDGELIIGGLIVQESVLTMEDTVVIYIGDKQEQLTNILLRLSDRRVLHYSVERRGAFDCRGDTSREFRERYGGVLRVKDAEVVGLIVGSMGLTAATTNELVQRLQLLVRTAGKKYYSFVMGRLNEAKLCNFPEVDIFCLISNDDNANIKPKTFHCPVVTPFELELGLGARGWSSSFSTDIADLLRSSIEDALELVRQTFPDAEEQEGSIINQSTVDIDTSSEQQAQGSSRELVLKDANGQQLTVFNSAAGEFLRQREYQGMQRFATTEQQVDTNIHTGLVGIAADYSKFQKVEESGDIS